MTDAENSGRKQRGRPFQPGQSGNPAGKPKGRRNATSMMLAALLDDEGEAVIRAMIESALAGDVSAGRAVMDRLVPPRRDRPVPIALPDLRTAADATAAFGEIARAVADGEVTPSEAADLGKMIDAFTRALEASDFEARLAALEMKGSTAR